MVNVAEADAELIITSCVVAVTFRRTSECSLPTAVGEALVRPEWDVIIAAYSSSFLSTHAALRLVQTLGM